MHELSVAQALVEQVAGVIRQHQAGGASRIRVRVGPLAGVVPELLASAFPIAAAGSRMEGAELEFAHAPIRVRCQSCGEETEAALNRLVCGACGDWRTRLVSGDELLLESVELYPALHSPLSAPQDV